MTLLLLGLVFLAFFANSASAYSYGSYNSDDSFYYKENVDGSERGFSINFKDNDVVPVRGYTYCGYYDWTSNGRKCARSGYDVLHYQNDAYNKIDHNAVLKDAFKTYQQSSKQQYQLESKRIDAMNRRHYGYGYGYGYSGVRYSYGW